MKFSLVQHRMAVAHKLIFQRFGCLWIWMNFIEKMEMLDDWKDNDGI